MRQASFPRAFMAGVGQPLGQSSGHLETASFKTIVLSTQMLVEKSVKLHKIGPRTCRRVTPLLNLEALTTVCHTGKEGQRYRSYV
jgi:hypothetical protein